MGRPRKPTKIRQIEGTRDRRPLDFQEAEPQPRGDVGGPPDYMSKRQRDIWNETLAESPPGLLTGLDRVVLETWVLTCDIQRQAAEKLAATPMILKTSSGSVTQSPYVRILNQQAVKIKALAAELGFSPAARTRISIGAEEVSDPTDKYFH